MIFTITSVIVFVFVIVMLVTILSIAEKKLLPQGDIRILINDDEDKSPTLKPGGTLLTALTSEKIFLPSACGGGGTCGMCTCQVKSGGGTILPTELSHISRADAKDDWRLACQVKVRENMNIHIPEEIFNIKKWECTVRSNHNVATFIKELVLELPAGENLDFKAGGYIQIDVPTYDISFNDMIIESEYREDWDKFNLWNLHHKNDEPIFRAYSMANHPAEGNIVMLNVRIATPPPKLWNEVPPGICSTYIFNLKPGDKVMVSGPYGEFFTKDTDREMVFIGGCAGMAPMRSHIFHLLKTMNSDRKISFWYGARSLREMFYHDEFLALEKEFPNFSYNVALSEPMKEDNWEGPTGFIHSVLYENCVKDHDDPTEIEYYMCGPPLMIDAVDNMLYNLGVEPEMVMYDKF